MRPPPPPDLPLRSPCSLTQRNLDPDPDLNLELNLVVDAPKAVVPLDLFLTLPRGDIGLDTDLVLDLNLVLDIDVLSLPPTPLSLSFLNNDPRRWGGRDPLFLVEIVIVYLTEEKAVALLLAFASLLFLKDDDINSDG